MLTPVPFASPSLAHGVEVLELSDRVAGARACKPMASWSGTIADVDAEGLKIEHTEHLDAGREQGKARRSGMEVEGPDQGATPCFNQTKAVSAASR